jgi:ACR3 family arsenite efflux pump ArsB
LPSSANKSNHAPISIGGQIRSSRINQPETVSQVALNDTIMVVAFASLVALLLGLSSITVPWDTLLLSVVLYIVVPVIVAQLWRRMLLMQGGQAALARTLRTLAPLSLSALLLTLVLLFGLQGEQIMRQPIVIALLAVPILIQVYFNAGLAYWLNRSLGVEWCVPLRSLSYSRVHGTRPVPGPPPAFGEPNAYDEHGRSRQAYSSSATSQVRRFAGSAKRASRRRRGRRC